jgi:hypothetical protein
MSFLVEYLLLNRESIKREADFESDDYNNLLLVERCIKNLYQTGRLSKKELINLDAFSIYNDEKVVAVRLKEHFYTVLSIFKTTCNRIAFELGSYFTDEGYVDYLTKAHNLYPHEIEILRKYIKRKHKVLYNRS